ncbi:hypothetical protein [Streptosporangium sp. NPDC051022]|uniref:hypothetical protein n=1 Tax=Streptosporangium sp. NPDC051022 TaxID=3155752 RepID=UPI0034472F16
MKGRRCALARCPRRATTTLRACGTVHMCEPCRELVEGAAAATVREPAEAPGGEGR